MIQNKLNSSSLVAHISFINYCSLLSDDQIIIFIKINNEFNKKHSLDFVPSESWVTAKLMYWKRTILKSKEFLVVQAN